VSTTLQPAYYVYRRKPNRELKNKRTEKRKPATAAAQKINMTPLIVGLE